MSARTHSRSVLASTREGSWYKLRQMNNVSQVLAERFRNYEPPRQRLSGLLFDHLFEDPLHVFQVIVLVPPHGAPRDLNALPCSIIQCPVGHYDVASFTEGRNHAADGGKSLCVDDASWSAEMSRDVCFCFDMYILGAIETWGRTGPHTVCSEDLNGLLFESLIRDQVVEVVRREVRHRAAIRKLRLRPSWSVDLSHSVNSSDW